MTQLFCCMISEEKFPPLTFNGVQNWVMQHLRVIEKIYYLCYELSKNTESTLKHDSVEKDV